MNQDSSKSAMPYIKNRENRVVYLLKDEPLLLKTIIDFMKAYGKTTTTTIVINGVKEIYSMKGLKRPPAKTIVKGLWMLTYNRKGLHKIEMWTVKRARIVKLTTNKKVNIPKNNQVDLR
jgi:hypothetical protein